MEISDRRRIIWKKKFLHLLQIIELCIVYFINFFRIFKKKVWGDFSTFLKWSGSLLYWSLT